MKFKQEEVVSNKKIPKELVIFSMTDAIELECPVGGCNHGVAGAKYKTPKLDQGMALQIMEIHVKSHDQGRGGDQRRQEPGNECFTKPEKTRRPSLQKGISEDKFLTFERQWARYKRSTGMQEESMIRAQLLACCSEELCDELDNFHGAQLDQKNEADLMSEMRKLSVVAQKNPVNIRLK